MNSILEPIEMVWMEGKCSNLHTMCDFLYHMLLSLKYKNITKNIPLKNILTKINI